MSDDRSQEQRNDRLVDAAAALVLIGIAIVTFTYWVSTQ